jgi:hypothetical protein
VIVLNKDTCNQSPTLHCVPEYASDVVSMPLALSIDLVTITNLHPVSPLEGNLEPSGLCDIDPPRVQAVLPPLSLSPFPP